jgi:hypothetical protein
VLGLRYKGRKKGGETMKSLVIIKTRSGNFKTLKAYYSKVHGVSKKNLKEIEMQLGESIDSLLLVENVLISTWNAESNSKKVFELFA